MSLECYMMTTKKITGLNLPKVCYVMAAELVHLLSPCDEVNNYILDLFFFNPKSLVGFTILKGKKGLVCLHLDGNLISCQCIYFSLSQKLKELAKHAMPLSIGFRQGGRLD